jgi:hypothetical protein
MTLTVPVPIEGAQAGTPWRAQSFLVDGGLHCMREPSFLLVMVEC